MTCVIDQTPNSGFYQVDSVEGSWNTGGDEKPNLGYKPRYKEGYFPVPPTDSLQDFRSRAVNLMKGVGIQIEFHHHEVGTAGQCEIDMRFKELTKHGRPGAVLQVHPAELRPGVRQDDHLHAQAAVPGQRLRNARALQPLEGRARRCSSGKEGTAELSQMALYYIGGLLKHSPALLAFCAPTTNSYRRLVPGYEAPINLVYSQRNRSAAAAFRCIPTARRPSAWSTAAPIRRPTATWLSPPC